MAGRERNRVARGSDCLARGLPSGIAYGTLCGMTSSTTEGTTMERAEKVRENRLRRMAERQGLQLVKSRRRDPRAIDYGGYMLVDIATNGVVAGVGAVGRPHWGLDDVEEYLTIPEA